MEKRIYKHFKGNMYEVIDTGLHSETLEEMVIYKALYGDGQIWIRPRSMWDDVVEYNGKKVKRFTDISEKISIEKSCGVIIYKKETNETKYLLLFQKGSDTWSVPKGHMEEGETKTQTAIREVFEETSLVIKLYADFEECVSYSLDNGNIKYVYLFLAEENGDVKIKKDEIADFKWVSAEEAVELLPEVGYGKVFGNVEKYMDFL